MSDGSTKPTGKIKEPKGLILAGIAAACVGIMADNLSALFTVTFVNGLHFSNSDAGILIFCAMGTLAAVSLTLASRINTLPLKPISIVGSCIAIVAYSYVGIWGRDDFGGLVVAMIVLGFGCGLTYAAGNAALSYARNTERAYSLLSFAYIVFTIIFMTAAPTLRAFKPFVGPYTAFMIFVVIAIAFVTRMPDTRAIAAADAAAEQELAAESALTSESSSAAPVRDASSPPANMVPILITLGLALLLVNLATSGIWTFSVELGTQAGMSAQSASAFLGLSQLIGFAGPMLSLVLFRFFSRVVVVVLFTLVLGVGILGSGLATSPVMFMAATLLLNLGYWAVLPIGLAVSADLDASSGRVVAAAVGASAIGTGCGPLVAGQIFNGGSNALGGIVLSLGVLLSIPLIVGPVRVADKLRAQRDQAERLEAREA